MFPGKKVELPDPRSTEDKFVVVIADIGSLSEQETIRIKKLLQETGASEIKESTVTLHEH
jgi:ACT domain-containing protein